MLALRCGPARLALDPSRGGEITQIWYHGRPVLAEMPWPRAEPAPEDAGETAWTRSWAGGWQLLFPNAGNRSVEGERVHSFHGAASHTPWEVLAATERQARLAWQDSDGLRVERAVRLDGEAVRVTTDVTNEGRAERAFVAVEHPILGSDLVADGCRLELPPGNLADLYQSAGRARETGPPAGRPVGSRTVDVAPGTARFHCLSEVREGRAACLGDTMTARLTWDVTGLPHLWVWEELRGTEAQPWDGRAVAVGLEPATVPTDAGLGAAVADGTANRLSPRARRSWWVTLQLGESPSDQTASARLGGPTEEAG